MPFPLRLLFGSLFVFSITAIACAENRTIDGTENNLGFIEQGASNQPFVRINYPNFSENQAFGNAANLPNSRDVSNAVSRQIVSIPSARGLSDYVWVWGQFLAHDLSLTTSSDGAEINGESPISIHDEQDPLGPKPINFVRSNFTTVAENTERISPKFPCFDCREQINEATSYIDASMVYGPTEARSLALRSNNGMGARLVTVADNLPPKNTAGLKNDNSGRFADDAMFLAGDTRANENPLLTSMHTIFLREHNRLVDIIQQQRPLMNDEGTFQLARKIVGAEIQAVTYNEFLPSLMGDNAPSGSDYQYNPEVIATVTQSFSHAINRWGHSATSPQLTLVEEDGGISGQFDLRDAFFDPTIIENDPQIIDSFLRGAASQVSQEIDVYVVDELRNFLFGLPGVGGLDLAALNIERGRDHGLPPYLLLQLFYGVSQVNGRFERISSDDEIVAALKEVYPDVFSIDPWVGALAEDHLPDSSFGQLTTAVTLDQFTRLRDGDRLFYLSNDAGLYEDGKLAPEIKSIVDLDSIMLADIIRTNTSITNLQDDIFFATSFPTSAVKGDFDKNRRLDVTDIDMLSSEIMLGEGDMSFDLNADFELNQEDRRVWIEDMMRTWFGDSNLDGEFNTSDLVGVFAAGEFEDQSPQNSTWKTGDWNGDLEFDTGDLVLAFQSGGYELGERIVVHSVPEPTTNLFTLALLFAVLANSKRQAVVATKT